VANSIIENLRSRIPYIRRLNKQIDELAYRLAKSEVVPELRAFDGTQTSEVSDQFRRFLRLLQPHDVVQERKRRFGRPGDGGYVMLEDLRPCHSALSFGIGTDVSWDIDIAAQGLVVLQFDDSIDRPPNEGVRFKFHRARVVGRRRSPAELTLSDILGWQELAADANLIAKIDIEGCEWELLTETKTTELARIRQLVIEFHGLRRFAEPAWRAILLAALEHLRATHVCIHVHGNNWVPFVVIGGIPFPDSFEASFVRRSDYAVTPSSAIFPTKLDYPNNPKIPDLYLGAWDY
jgi:hypothetical protein